MFQRLEGNNELLVSSPARQQTSEMPPDYLRQIFQIILRKRRTFKAKSYCNIEILHNEKIIMSLRLGCQGQMFPKCWPMPGFFGGFVQCALIPQDKSSNHIYLKVSLWNIIYALLSKMSRVAFTHFYGPNRSGCLDWGVGGGVVST